MRKPIVPVEIFKERRQSLRKEIENAAIVLFAHPEHVRNHDVHFPYRADTNMFYLTGFEEPESVLIFRPGKDPETVLFVRKKDLERETWDGFRYGPEGAKEQFQVDQAFAIESFEDLAPQYLSQVEKIYFKLYQHPENDRLMERVLKATTRLRGRSGRGILPIFDSTQLLGEYRLIKSQYEINTHRRACEITARGHIELMKLARPGLNERELQGHFTKSVLAQGAAREGYSSIVASGSAATTLHYVFNDQTLKDGDLLLIDAGAEYEYYTGDITRTFPVNGKFSIPQKRLYEKVLRLQKQLVEMVQPGLVFKDLQTFTIAGLTEIMIEEGLLKGFKEDIIKSHEYKRYYPHGVSHWLGMDVHDSGLYEVAGHSRRIEPGMIFTIEPGIYIPENDLSAPKELRGIGIRIEDDVLVTKDGVENLTVLAPKEIDEIESLVGKAHS